MDVVRCAMMITFIYKLNKNRKMLKRFFRYSFLALALYVITCLATPYNTYLHKRSTMNQISYLGISLKNGLDDHLQMQYPEGKIFSNAIFGLAVLEFCLNHNLEDKKYASLLDQTINRLLSEEAKIPFDAELQPKYGVFYNAWILLVLKQYRQNRLFKKSEIQTHILSSIAQIDQRILAAQKDSIKLLPSYQQAVWPADNCIALLSCTEDSIRSKWLRAIFDTSDHPSTLIPHSLDQRAIIRGSSQALITYFLQLLDYPKIQDYNTNFKSLFIDQYLGLQLVKEHEDAASWSDFDSGPVFLSYGAVATIMNIRTQAAQDKSSAKITWACMNTLACPIHLFGAKYYLFQQAPMFDIFMLWASVGL